MQVQTETILLTIGGLLLFGALYAILINWMRKTGYLEGYTAVMVVGGVIVTLIINKAIHHPDPAVDFIGELACFGASGAPMIVESFVDYARRRNEHIKSIVQAASDEAGNG